MTAENEEIALTKACDAAPNEEDAQTDGEARNGERQDERFLDQRGPAFALFANENPRGRHADHDAEHERGDGDPETSHNRVAVEFEHLFDPFGRKARLEAAEGVLHEGREAHLHDRNHEKEKREAGENRLGDLHARPRFLLCHGSLLNVRSGRSRDGPPRECPR